MQWYTDKNGKKRPITSKGHSNKEPTLHITRKSNGLSEEASKFISKAISERRHKHPKESREQSIAIAYSKARKHGFHVPEVSK